MTSTRPTTAGIAANTPTRGRRVSLTPRVAVVAMSLLTAAACAGESSPPPPDDAGATDTGATDGGSAEPSAEATAGADAASDDDTREESTANDTAATSEPTTDAAFPVTIEHAFGTTAIEDEPERVVTFGFSDHSYALAVGVVPVGLRKTYDAQPFVVFPWVQDDLGGATPELIGFAEPSFEQIAALRPDVILAVNERLDERVYEILSAIAPTVATPRGYTIQTVPWRETMKLIGRALGRVDEADAVVADLEQRFADTLDAHPSFAGSTVSVAFHAAATGRLGSYTVDNARYQFLAEIGFEPPPALIDLAPGDTLLELGEERIDLLDADAVVWNPASGDRPGAIREIPTRRTALPAASERREIVSDLLTAAAMTESSPPSLVYALERLVPELAAAVDGDPDTIPPSAEPLYRTDDGAVPTADEQAAMDVWELVLGSDASIDERRPHIEDFEALAETVEEALRAGEELGGVSVRPESATITGDTAVVVFTAGVGDVEVPGLIANLDRVDGVWVARRAELCAFLAFVGVECPN